MLMLALSLWNLATATPVLIQSKDADRLDYLAKIRATGEWQSPTQWYQAHLPLPKQTDELTLRLEEAQSALINSDTQLTQKKFSEILNLWTETDWDKQHRQVFLYSALRLAQFSTGLKDRDHWVMVAVSTGLDIEPEAELFPPPILKQYGQLKSKVSKLNPSSVLKNTDWDAIIINGQICDRQRCPEFPINQFPARITWISDRYQPVHENSETSRIAENGFVAPKGSKLWVEGDCSQPKISSGEFNLGETTPFFDRSCGKAKPIFPQSAHELSKPLPLPSVPNRENDSKWLRSPWFWAGAAAVTAAVIWQTQKRDRSDGGSEPSTTYGLRF